MSLLNIPHCSFPQALPTPTCSRSQTLHIYYIHGKKLQGKPLQARSLEWGVWPNGKQSSKHWYEPRAHTDPPLRQPPRFPVPGRRYRDLHHRSRRFAALRSIQQQQANSSKQSSFNVRTFKPLETDGRSCVGSTRLPRNCGSFAQRICCNDEFCSQSKGKRDRDTNVVHSLKDTEHLQKHP